MLNSCLKKYIYVDAFITDIFCKRWDLSLNGKNHINRSLTRDYMPRYSQSTKRYSRYYSYSSEIQKTVHEKKEVRKHMIATNSASSRLNKKKRPKVLKEKLKILQVLSVPYPPKREPYHFSSGTLTLELQGS